MVTVSENSSTEVFHCFLCHFDPENEFHRSFRWQMENSRDGSIVFALSDMDQLVDACDGISEERKTELKARNADTRRRFRGNMDAVFSCPRNHLEKGTGFRGAVDG